MSGHTEVDDLPQAFSGPDRVLGLRRPHTTKRTVEGLPVRSLGRRVLLALVAAVAVTGCSDGDPVAERQAEVAERGAEVMPFDLDATTHVFTKTADGGIQLVAADDPDDRHQVDLIRRHLAEERDNFARGDFNDPAQIHGHDMPGLAELSAGYADIDVAFAETSDGARLTYMTEDAQLVEAVHAWFDRQLMDHGAHAEAGVSHHGK